MCDKRFSKLLLVVLALALWAGTAYGQALTASPTTWTTTYTIGQDVSTVQTTVGVTAASNGTGYTVASDSLSWLTCTASSGTANIAPGENITIAVIDAGADSLTPGSNSGNCYVTANSNLTGTPDAVVAVTLMVSPVVPSISTVGLTYIKNGGASQAAASVDVTITDAGGPDSYTYNSTCPAWVLFTSAQAWSASSSQSDTFTVSVDNTSATVNGLDAGTGTCAVNLVYSATNVWPITVNWTVNNPGGGGVSPLSLAVSGPIALTYVRFGGAQLATTAKTAVVDSLDSTAETVTAVFTGTAAPSWLTAVPVVGHTTASSSTPAQVAFTVATGSTGADVATPGAYGPYTVNLAVAGQPVLAVTVNVTISAQTLAFTTTSATLSYATGTSATTITASPAPLATSTLGSVAFTSDASTLPWWLNAVTGSATAAGGTITVQGNPGVLTGMTVGNYSANVGFWATTTPTHAVPEFYLTVTLSVSSSVASISVGTAPAAVILQPGATVPTPIVTPVSSVGDVGFTIKCAATSTFPGYTPQILPLSGCTLKNGNNPAGTSITGIAYTWGTPLNVIIDPNLFSGATAFGTQVLVTVTVTATTDGSAPPAPLVLTYNFQPVAATLSSISPLATIEAGTEPVNVTISGANFVSAANIIGSSLVPTEVFISTTATISGVVSAWTQVVANVTVASSGAIVVTIPAASLPTFTPSATLTTEKLYIGVANQIGASAPNPAAAGFEPDAHASLDVTTNPVIGAITSTATYIQPNPGTMQTVAPYELVSLFGANFGATSAVVATPDATYSKYPTALTVGTSGGKNIVLKVNFAGSVTAAGKTTATTYSAPILFANANQINVVVPSGLNLGTVQVSVSSGTASSPPPSDGFPVNYVAAQPGIFTLTSQGTGQGAIVNNSTGVVNGPGNGAVQGTETLAIYMTGLGAPNSAATDAASNSGSVYPTNCVSVASYLSLVNTAVTTGTKYTPPSPAWTGLEGALMTRVLGGFAPCMLNSVGATTVTVSFNGGVAQPATYAGFVGDSVAGLYQVNVLVPGGLTTLLAGPVTIPLTVTIGTFTSPPVNVVIHP
jgi:uncharacterized protein (TIGR03437 family)